MKFTKMHGIGNDYIYVDCFKEKAPVDPAKVSIAISDRHFGVGSDGLILIMPSDKADVRMRMYNADGSEGEMCGNGIRCVAKYAFEHGLSKSDPMRIETGRGVLTLALQSRNGKVESVTVDMGEPALEHATIPFDTVFAKPTASRWVFKIALEGDELEVVPVSTGNPHAVTFVDDVSKIALYRIGPIFERHKTFPARVNAHWVQVISRNEVRMRTWERGSGITLACGTGASAVCVAGALTGRTERKILVHLPGGDLNLEWRESDNHAYMTGPATEVFTGEWNS